MLCQPRSEGRPPLKQCPTRAALLARTPPCGWSTRQEHQLWAATWRSGCSLRQAKQLRPCLVGGGVGGCGLSPLAWTLGVPFTLTASSLAFTPRHFAGNSPCSSLWGAALPNRIEPDLHQGHWRSVLTWCCAVPLRRLEDRWVLTTHTPPGPQRDLKQKARPASDILCAQSSGYYWKF